MITQITRKDDIKYDYIIEFYTQLLQRKSISGPCIFLSKTVAANIKLATFSLSSDIFPLLWAVRCDGSYKLPSFSWPRKIKQMAYNDEKQQVSTQLSVSRPLLETSLALNGKCTWKIMRGGSMLSTLENTNSLCITVS